MVSVGVDEVGRGSWAGPLVAGAVILEKPIEGLNDSKLLSKNKRESLVSVIQNRALAYGLGWVTPAEIDRLGLTNSVGLAMARALGLIHVSFDEIIIDGNFNFLAKDPRSRTLIKADQLVAAVSAASVIAKVARDQFMERAALLYPKYGFESHVGYGTTLHLEALKKFGVCELHRRSYRPIKAFILD